MFPTFDYEIVTQRIDELWRLADEARRAKEAGRGRERRRRPRGGVRRGIGARLVRAGRSIGGDEPVRPVPQDC